jgi:hypothetical protein
MVSMAMVVVLALCAALTVEGICLQLLWLRLVELCVRLMPSPTLAPPPTPPTPTPTHHTRPHGHTPTHVF